MTLSECTYCPPCTTSPKRSFPLIPILAVILVFAIAVQLTFHSVARHGSESEAVDQACGKNTFGLWENTNNGKFYQLCQMPDGSFGIRVLVKNTQDTFRKVTAFIRKVHGKPVFQIEEVINYITEGSGATKFLGIP